MGRAGIGSKAATHDVETPKRIYYRRHVNKCEEHPLDEGSDNDTHVGVIFLTHRGQQSLSLIHI